MQAVTTVILTRLLTPNDFGLFAIALSVVFFGNMLNEFGFSQALIQKKDLVNDDIRYVFTLQLTFAIIVTLVVILLSPWLASFFQNENIVGVLKAISLVFVIQAFGLTSTSLLQRSLDFKKIQIIQVSSYFISYAFIGIPMAYLSYGVWSLVAAQLAQAFLTATSAYVAQRHPISLLFLYKDKKYVLNFGGKVIANNIVNWAVANVDIILIGHFLGTKTLGYYNRANALILMPSNIIIGSIKGILFSLYSKIQHNKPNIKKTFFGSVAMISIVIFPISLTIAAIPGTIVLAVFGDQWVILDEIITPLSLAIAMRVLAGMGGPLVWGQNKGELEISAQIYSLITMACIILILVQVSIVYASWGLFLSNCFRFFFVNRVALKIVNVGWKEYFAVLRKPLYLAMVVSFFVFMGDQAFNIFSGNIYVNFAWDVFLAGAVLFIVLYSKLSYFIEGDLLWIMEKSRDNLPKFVGKKLFDITGSPHPSL